MKRLIILLSLIILTAYTVRPVQAAEYTAPPVPSGAEEYMPPHTESFGEGLWKILKFAVSKMYPAFADAASVCFSVISVILLISLLQTIPGNGTSITALAGCVSIGLLFLKPAHTLIGLGAETITTLYDYGKLLLPVMTSALAAQGGITSSAVLYTGTALFCSLLTGFVLHFIVPMLYIFLCLSVACSAIRDDMLNKIRDFVKWLMIWSLKTILYIFTGYLTITGVVSGTADASAIKAAKLTISGMVPVVGGILSDASETILISAGIMKNSAGVYGLLAMTAVWIGPFLRIACQYLLTKLTSAVCSVIGSREASGLVEDFAGAMGIVLAMTGAVCLFLMISTVCFMKGVS